MSLAHHYLQYLCLFLLITLVINSFGQQIYVNRQMQKTIYFPWRTKCKATLFWIGEKPSGRNKTPNYASSWDRNWQKNYGGCDHPDNFNQQYYRPFNFIPQQNPFYIALPYNDCINHLKRKPEATKIIPWRNAHSRHPLSLCKGMWLEIRYKNKRCFAQWEDCGPFFTDDWKYVFLGAKPKSKEAAIDLSPAVYYYLGITSGEEVAWRFVLLSQVPAGPWRKYGNNNPFVKQQTAKK